VQNLSYVLHDCIKKYTIQNYFNKYIFLKLITFICFI